MARSYSRGKGTPRRLIKRYHAVVRPRGNPALGQRNALDMGIWTNLEDAMVYCVALAEQYFEWGYGISDCTIESFKGMVDC